MFRFIGSEQNNNLFVCQRNSAAKDKRAKMLEVGRIHIGDHINVFKQGRLGRQNLGDTSSPHTGDILFGIKRALFGSIFRGFRHLGFRRNFVFFYYFCK